MPIFRRENDGRRVAKFPDKATAQDTIRLIAKSGALSATKKPTKAESAATRGAIKEIQTDAKTLANMNPKEYASVEAGKDPSPWDDNKGNFEAHRHVEIWPSKDSPTGKPGQAEYQKAPPPASSKPVDPWA